jgi:hypothetical protein
MDDDDTQDYITYQTYETHHRNEVLEEVAKAVHGFKAFEKDFTCRGIQYEIGKTYKHKGEVEPCKSGFHFCEKPLDVLGYYGNVFNQKYALVEGFGSVKKENDKNLLQDLSMGMSSDYEDAIKFGATYLRIGSLIFKD